MIQNYIYIYYSVEGEKKTRENKTKQNVVGVSPGVVYNLAQGSRRSQITWVTRKTCLKGL